MSKLYDGGHRQLQDEFGTRGLADTVEGVTVKTGVDAADRAFIHSRDMFFLSTVNHQGQPTVSYKGGDPGFVRVVDEKTLIFPSYDGNGMFLSLGNIERNGNVGILFIDFEKPHRLRLHGKAKLSRDDGHMSQYKEPDLVVVVTVGEIFRNCPRYIHQYKKLARSEYVPRAACETPMPDWKRLDAIQKALPPKDQGKAGRHGGTLTMDELAAREQRHD